MVPVIYSYDEWQDKGMDNHEESIFWACWYLLLQLPI